MMTKNMRKIVSFVLIFALVMGLGSVAAFGESYGELLRGSSVTVNKGVELNRTDFWSSAKDGPQVEHYLKYSKNSAVLPVITYGNAVYGTYKLSTVVKKAQDEGYRVLAVMNGDFYNTANGVPTGVVISDGKLLCSENSKWPAVGFREDGSAVIGRLDLSIRADSTSLENGLGGLGLNRPLDKTSGVALFTGDFSATNKATMPAWNVLLTIVEGAPAVNSVVTARVESVFESEGEVPLQQGQLLLSIPTDTSFTATFSKFITLQTGEMVTFTFSGNEAWNDVKYAIGGGDMLLAAGENVAPEGTGYQPRTAVGITEDGNVILYTIDGRQTGYSVGASEYAVAERLKELGCVEAINLDGGGSTALHLIMPGEDVLTQINKSSEGSLRSVSNYILLVTKDKPTEQLANLHLYPYDSVLLAGATQSFSVKGTDANYYPVAVDGAPKFTTDDKKFGSIDATGLFTAGPEEGTSYVNVSHSGVTGFVPVRVIKTPHSITLKNETSGKDISGEIVLTDNQTLSLSASSLYNRLPLVSQDHCYTWTLEGNKIGSVDGEGLFTATTMSGTAVLKATAGDTSASLTIRVNGSDFFLDTLTHWSREYVNALYKDGVITGTVKPEGLLYRPDDNMTRAEFAAVVSRWLLLDPVQYASVELPFADLAQIPTWAVPYVKCVYGEGIVKGSQSNGVLKFNPNSTITREEAMTIIGRTVNIDPNSPDLTFSDSSKVSDWALPYVKTMVEKGVISGSGNKLTPKNPVTRSQVAKIIYTMDTVEFPEILPPEPTPEEPETPVEPEASEGSQTQEPSEGVEPEEPFLPEEDSNIVNPVPGILPEMPEGL